MLEISEINAFKEFNELKDEWNAVLAESRDNNPYLTWEYLSNHWKHFGNEKKLRILTIKDNDKIIAIAPLRQSRYSFLNKLGYEVIEPLGYRHTDYTGFIIAEREKSCLKLILDYLFEHDSWDFAYLLDFAGTSGNSALLSEISKIVPKFELKEGVACPYLSLPNSANLFMQSLGAKFRKNLRIGMKKLYKDHHRVEFKRYDKLGSVEESVKIFIELHQKRWKMKGMPGAFGSRESRDFCIDEAKSFANKGWLALYFLTVKDNPIAAQYCYEYNQKMYDRLSGFDPDYSQYSVGNLLLQKIIEKCIERKIREFDFMKGAEPYKYRWTRTYRRNLHIRFVNKKRIISNLRDMGIKTLSKTRLDKILGRFLNF